MNINKLRNSLINSELSIAAVARKTKLSRTALHNFINGGSIRESTAEKIDIVLHNLNKDIRLSGGHNMQASKIIDLQDKAMTLQENEIKRLLKEIETLKNTQFQFKNHPSSYPDAFEDMSNMVEEAQNTWNWTFLNSPTPMSIANMKGIITSVNLSLVNNLGYNHPDDMQHKHILEYIHPEDHDKAKKAMTKSNRNLVCRVLKANKQYCKISIKAKTFDSALGDSFSIAHMECIDKCNDLN